MNENAAAGARPEYPTYYKSVNPEGVPVALVCQEADFSLTFVRADGVIEQVATFDDVRSKIGGEIVPTTEEDYNEIYLAFKDGADLPDAPATALSAAAGLDENATDGDGDADQDEARDSETSAIDGAAAAEDAGGSVRTDDAASDQADLPGDANAGAVQQSATDGSAAGDDQQKYTLNEVLTSTDEAMKLAAEHGVDINDVTGTGENGNRTVGDVREFIAKRDQGPTH